MARKAKAEESSEEIEVQEDGVYGDTLYFEDHSYDLSKVGGIVFWHGQNGAPQCYLKDATGKLGEAVLGVNGGSIYRVVESWVIAYLREHDKEPL